MNMRLFSPPRSSGTLEFVPGKIYFLQGREVAKLFQSYSSEGFFFRCTPGKDFSSEKVRVKLDPFKTGAIL